VTRGISGLKSSYTFTTATIAAVLALVLFAGFAAYTWHLYTTRGCGIRVKSVKMKVTSQDGLCRAGEKIRFDLHVFSQNSINIGATIAALRLREGYPAEVARLREDAITYHQKLANGEDSSFLIPCEFLLADEMKRSGMQFEELAHRLYVFVEPCSVGNEIRGKCQERCSTWAIEDLRQGKVGRLRRLWIFGQLAWSDLFGTDFSVPDEDRVVDSFDITHDVGSYRKLNLYEISQSGQFRRDDLDRDLVSQQHSIGAVDAPTTPSPETPIFQKEDQGGLGYFKKVAPKGERNRRRHHIR